MTRFLPIDDDTLEEEALKRSVKKLRLAKPLIILPLSASHDPHCYSLRDTKK